MELVVNMINWDEKIGISSVKSDEIWIQQQKIRCDMTGRKDNEKKHKAKSKRQKVIFKVIQIQKSTKMQDFDQTQYFVIQSEGKLG